MKFETIKTNYTYELKFKCDEELEIGNLGLLNENVNKLRINGKVIKIVHLGNISDLTFRFNNSLCVVVKILGKSRGCYVGDFICFRSPKEIIFETIYIDKEKINKYDLERENFIVAINNQKYIVIMGGNDTWDKIIEDKKSQLKRKKERLQKIKNFKEKNSENVDNEIKELENLEQKLVEFSSQDDEKMAFSILSDDKFLAVKRIDSNKFMATKLAPIKNFEFSNLKLLELRDDLKFENKATSEEVTEKLTKELKINSKYLEIWDKYANQEGEMLLNRARKVGCAKINKGKCEFKNNRFIIGIDRDLREVLSDGDIIAFSNEIPIYLSNKNLTWEEYCIEYLQNSSEIEKQKPIQVSSVSSDAIKIAIAENLELETLKKFKYIMLDIYGNKIDLKRKKDARDKIKEGKIANPDLALILQDENLVKDRNKNNIPAFPYSSKVKDKCFQNPPTPNQEEAIEIALNTPDFAIIQGPPGTGKTTVLTAIVERLNEISDKSKNIKGSILVSAFQHDAVENVISRMRVNGLPPIKFGKKSKSVEDLTSFYNIMQWGKDITDKIEIAPNSQVYLKFDELVKKYKNRPCRSTQIALLENISQMRLVEFELKKKAADRLIELKFEENMSDDLQDLKEIYAIRTNLTSFADDGIERNKEALMKFLDKNDTESYNLLCQKENIDEEYIKKLKDLRIKLLKRWKSKVEFDVEKIDEDLVTLINDIEISLNQSEKEKINFIKARFKDALCQDPFALQKMIKDYSVVYSATTGQSQSGYIIREKCKSYDDKNYTYENVIIDEAARASPIDLFLVLMLSKNRMILVGDHRQLPHMIEDEIVEKLESNEEVDILKILKESIFEFLIDRVKKLENIDGVKRFITLNNQYRTHPLLGKFISDNFYKEFDEEFDSPLNENYFKHDLDGIENIPAVWIDVKEGKVQRNSGSCIRESEVEAIASYLRKWKNNDFSFGIISFYSAQVNRLKEVLKNEIETMDNRFRIGTVDSFQGMEFDIVFLSIVRSERSFGFLRSVNRLCVSMSRQKRCLIVVGNKDFFTTQKAQEQVKGLYNFTKLCESKGVVL